VLRSKSVFVINYLFPELSAAERSDQCGAIASPRTRQINLCLGACVTSYPFSCIVVRRTSIYLPSLLLTFAFYITISYLNCSALNRCHRLAFVDSSLPIFLPTSLKHPLRALFLLLSINLLNFSTNSSLYLWSKSRNIRGPRPVLSLRVFIPRSSLQNEPLVQIWWQVPCWSHGGSGRRCPPPGC